MTDALGISKNARTTTHDTSGLKGSVFLYFVTVSKCNRGLQGCNGVLSNTYLPCIVLSVYDFRSSSNLNKRIFFKRVFFRAKMFSALRARISV